MKKYPTQSMGNILFKKEEDRDYSAETSNVM